MRRYCLFYNIQFQLIIIFLIIIRILKIQSLLNYKSIYISNNNYLVITPTNLYYYNSNDESKSNVHNFSGQQIINSEEESAMINFGYFRDGTNPVHLLLVKHYIYALYNGEYICDCSNEDLFGYYSEIYAITCTTGYCYYILGFINSDKKLQLFLMQNPKGVCPSTKMFSVEINNVDSSNINCQFMQSSNGEVLTCFYQSSNEIVASSFKTNINEFFPFNTNIENITNLMKTKSNNEAKIIKSTLSQDRKKALVCYTNNDSKCNCLIYDIINNEWSDYDTYLTGCLLEISSLYIEYLEKKNEYIVYCFQSSTRFDLQKFNSTFGKEEDEENGIYELSNSLANCPDYYLYSFIHNSDDIKILTICDNSITNIEAINLKFIPSTIITTILTTLTSFPTRSPSTIPIIPTTYLSFILSSYVANYPSITSTIHNSQNDNNIIQKNSEKSKEEIINNLDKGINDFDIGKVYEIFGDDYNIKISPINSKQYENISTYIDFSNCEKLIRQSNTLSESSVLTVYQIEIDNPNQQSLINHVEYAVFNENKEKLDLSVCENELIEIKYQLNTSMINKTKVKYYADLGIDIFNIKDDFFNDICYSYSEGDSDIILNDRVTDIYQNISVCENNCNYNKINLTDYTVSCICSIKKEVSTEYPPPRLDQIIRDTFEDSNVAVIKCYNLVFSLKNKLKNAGFWIFTILVFLHFPFFIYYFIYNISSIKKYIFVEMNKFNYWCQIINPPKKENMKRKYQRKVINNKSKKNNRITTNSYLINLKDYKTSSTTLNLKKKKYIKINKEISSINNNKNDIIGNLKLKSNQVLLKNAKNNKNIKTNNLSRNKNKNKNMVQPIVFMNYKILNNYKNSDEALHINCINSTQKILTKVNKINKDKKIKLSPKFYSLIQIDANNSSNTKPINSNFILNNYDYETALKYDRRNFLRIIYICILAKENIINILFFKTPLDIQSLRICLFIFTYSCDLAFNTIFFTNENISDKYHYQGNNLFLFSMVNNLLQSVISSVVSIILVNIFQHMIESRDNFEDIFRDEEKKMRKDKNYKVSRKTKLEILDKIRIISSKLKTKIILFIIIEFMIMIFFYYFVTAFCEVYKKTQNAWLYDFFTSFFISFSYEILGAFIIAIFYILSIRYKIKFVYNIALFLYSI